MGNQPPRDNLPGKGRARHTRKMIDNTKKFTANKNFEKAVKIAMGAGLKDAGTGFLAAAVIAGAKSFQAYKTQGPTIDIQKVINDTVTTTIKDKKLDVTEHGRAILKSSISETIAYLK